MFDFIIIYYALFVTLKSRLSVNLIVGRTRKKPSLVIGGGVDITAHTSATVVVRSFRCMSRQVSTSVLGHFGPKTELDIQFGGPWSLRSLVTSALRTELT